MPEPLAAPAFDPSAYSTFRFLERSLEDGHVRLEYALDDGVRFVETFDLPPGGEGDPAVVANLLALLHWIVGVSYFKTAVPPEVDAEVPPATARLLEALYSEGLGEFAYVNRLPLPRPRFAVAARTPAPVEARAPRYLVPVGGGKDSVVALEIVRRSGHELALFSVGDAKPIARTVAVSGLPRLLVRRTLDPDLRALNAAGALNGHIPVTAIVATVALLTAALHGYTGVVLANERSASAGNLHWDGIEVNHQFSKSARAEHLLRAAVEELTPGLELFSVLRPASELSIARAFARLPPYHHAFTSCNAIFRLDPALRASSWCRDCPKCRFVFLILAPFLPPEALRGIFGGDLLEDPAQFEGFALLTATGGNKPFECVGTENESTAALRLLERDPRWRDHAVVRRLAAEVERASDLGDALALSDEHAVPAPIMDAVREVLGA